MKRIAVLSALSLLITIAAAGLAFAAPIQIRMNATSNPKASPDLASVHWYQTLEKELKQRLGDKVRPAIYWDRQLAKSFPDAINATQNNMIQIMNVPSSSMAEYSKAMIPLNALYVIPYPHSQIMRNALQGALGEAMRQQILKDTGLRVLTFWDYGFRYFMTRTKPIYGVADLKDMKFRCQSNQVQLAAFKAYGANPTPISWSELFTSLQQGVIDGTENPLVNVTAARLYEVTKYFSKSGHLVEANCVLVNDKWYQDLPADVRKEFDAAVKVADEVYFRQFDETEAKYMEFVATKMTVNDIAPEEMKKLAEIGREASAKEVVQQVGQEYYDYVMGELAKAEKEYMATLKK